MKKLDIAALITGIASLFLCIGFMIACGFVGLRTFKDEGGVTKIADFFKSAKEEFVNVTGDNFIDVNDGSNHISIGPDGVFVESGDDKVVVSPSGIYVADGDEEIVDIGANGVIINDNSDEAAKTEETDEEGIRVIG